jgi:predicted AlkP superfamily pyrophosphatase or phosphodiesterase
MLHQLHKEGALSAGGFERFFREGQVADRMLPVNPTITAVNHISLATGYPAGQTGIVSNTFHAAGTPFLQTVSGFAAPIQTETLWEAFKRQGKRVGVVTWPGVDGTAERRFADFGLVYASDADREPAVVTLKRSDWSNMQEGPETRGLKSYSPILRSRAVIGKEGQFGREFELLAVDRSDDKTVNYDAVVPLTSGERALIQPGDWARIPCQDPRPNRLIRSTFCWIKVLRLDPGLGDARVYFNGLYSNLVYPKTYEINLSDASLLWPGPPDDRALSASWRGEPGIDLDTWLEQSSRFTAFFGGALRAATGRADWDLLLGYIPSIDEAGHQLLLSEKSQPGFTPERRDAFAAARRKVWQSVDRELAAFLKTVDLESTAVVIVSDHGMAPAHTGLDLNVLLEERGLLTAGENGKPAEGTRAYAVPSGGVAEVYVDPAAPDRDKVIADLHSLFSGWSEGGKKPIARVVTRQEQAALGLESPNSGDLVVFAADGYLFTSDGLKSGHALAPATVYGMHGYLNTDPRMAGIYLALGAGVTPGNPGTVQNTDVAGRIAEWLGIEKPRPRAE